MISKIRNEFLMSVLLKIGRDQGKLAEIKAEIYNLAENLKALKEYRNVKFIFDVDPA
jgi:primosomal protein N' (replication factor Y)